MGCVGGNKVPVVLLQNLVWVACGVFYTNFVGLGFLLLLKLMPVHFVTFEKWMFIFPL